MNKKYKGLLYNEFYEDNGIIILFSENEVFHISLEKENIDIWKDYLEIGDYRNAKKFCPIKELIIKIDKINAEEDFEKKDFFFSALNYANSDEKFEVVCLKYIMANQFKALNMYLNLYLSNNYDNIMIRCLISCLQVVLFLNNSLSENKEIDLPHFRDLIKERSRELKNVKDFLFSLFIIYGKMKELENVFSIFGDFDNLFSFFIRYCKIDEILEKLSGINDLTLGKEEINLNKFFLDNLSIFLKKSPKKTINLLNNKIKYIKIKDIIRPLIRNIDINQVYYLDSKEKEINNNLILNFIKNLLEIPNNKDDYLLNRIYIYYLSLNKANEKSLIEYLKNLLISKKNFFDFNYIKKLFKNNIPAYALSLAAMGKQIESIKILNNSKEDFKEIRNIILINTPENLREKLWIELCLHDNHHINETILKINETSLNLKKKYNMNFENYFEEIDNYIEETEEYFNKLKDDIAHYKEFKKVNIIGNNKIKKSSKKNKLKICECEICKSYKIDNCINEIFLDNGKNNKSNEDLNKNYLFLKLTNEKLTKQIIEYEKNDFKRNNKISLLKTNLEKKENENEILNQKIKDLQNFISSHKNIINKKMSEKNRITELVEELMVKEKEIAEIKSRYPCELLKNEHLLIVTFISKSKDIHYSLLCKNTDKFSNLENNLYEKYPELKEYNKTFYYNGNSINRFKNLEENKICNNAIINF